MSDEETREDAEAVLKQLEDEAQDTTLLRAQQAAAKGGPIVYGVIPPPRGVVRVARGTKAAKAPRGERKKNGA